MGDADVRLWGARKRNASQTGGIIGLVWDWGYFIGGLEQASFSAGRLCGWLEGSSLVVGDDFAIAGYTGRLADDRVLIWYLGTKEAAGIIGDVLMMNGSLVLRR